VWSNDPHEATKHTRDGTKFNLFPSLFKQSVFGPSFFAKHIVTGIDYLQISEEFNTSILIEEGSE
jgi:hypothetical protein